ncbi:MAG: hypothetical protein A3C43_11560 [Candidatus Schekmanbacteria bacterium RIFCSPHIGHO2_02_FULL_38_11]|uniref:Peptidase n=1 Tax=Candidatus Schekmanbacteria bacterium RIFCSPLOWO2_12_FULL_38_15 TaxID=1817883 RepID=A0A1F7SNH6_9BACT|nr:MAG: hypothetical protein A2043_05140 [Candidatus Schekmanbacteria bacterium GWA2_38_9]OGL51758.1 MAG: hypothetical protein A3H37_11980 [Candidatus Schekmanbacteria bacterium RIFCSPLOWO2_02_FULL_38_14]OGL52424.1 MAG: hypothetical protein A3C43_11560 [Candidatus Schekmanbacteria bacterium RIFCSPHIGHO2_02_FULL_38_11]OGL54754.1 MAG: hypothetical protein A3G31_09530 [Candidatus Schekmanbacteria bacterium RIFCSPLOWO2_12_FULL_38_15]
MKEKDLVNAIKNLYHINLGVRKGERVLVFSDCIKESEKISMRERKRREELLQTAKKTFEAGSEITSTTFISYDATLSHGAEPPEFIWEEAFGKKIYAELRDSGLLLKFINKREEEKDLKEAEELIIENKNDAVDVVIAMANFSVSHTKFRDFLTGLTGARFASLPLFDPSMFLTSMDVDWEIVAKRTKLIAYKLTQAHKAMITSPNGTNITLGLKGRDGFSDTGILKNNGDFGNLPAGEAFIAPVEDTADGMLVIEWAPTEKLSSPIVFEIKNGKIFLVRGVSEYALSLRNKLDENPLNKTIAELGIGTNYMASRIDNILEAEKISGTIHIAFGDNKSFGGKVRTSFHQDFIVLEPTLTLEYEDGSREVIVDRKKIVCLEK